MHLTLGESIGMTAEVYERVCTDLPPSRKLTLAPKLAGRIRGRRSS